MNGVINVAAIVPVTEAEGPGKRFALWVRGCPLRCPGCCNPQFLEDRMIDPIQVKDVLDQVLKHRDEIEGVTFIGGEPFAQAAPLAELAREIRQRDLSVMVFTGYPLDQLRDPAHEALLRATDLLIDGPYRHDLPDRSRRWIGSTNQTIHFLTPRYEHLRDHWPRGQNTLELRLKNGQVTINGFPHPLLTRLNRKAAS